MVQIQLDMHQNSANNIITELPNTKFNIGDQGFMHLV